MLLLYDFCKTGGSIDEQASLSEAYRYDLFNTMTAVGLSTVQAYLQVKRYQALSVVARNNIDSLDKVKQTAQLRADAGLSSQSDVLQAETRIAGMVAALELPAANCCCCWWCCRLLTCLPACLPALRSLLALSCCCCLSLLLTTASCFRVPSAFYQCAYLPFSAPCT